ncbi:FAD-containing oxidoreductase [Hyphomicrobium sp. LHD-15]|uniref:FAD-containing oxidoreductase n=1 Tax=Hyphomicrobium sp. LHD-15 TaxID=3072142 RepID=UPI00280F8EE2|nr:FAD-containing oxidoreductase [Hyphomicrobium sp. LHD-15]MDQ8699462.1 FAD-containing oxidoreductase [Hyphomicrobium sp. LHD-15]
MSSQFDAVIIGTGQAGPSLANRLSQAGQKIAVIERACFGGTCVNTGCMPTKTLVASAYAAHHARRAADYGVLVQGQIGIDMRAVKARKDKVSDSASKNIEAWLRSMPGCTVLQGHARFVSPDEIHVGGEHLKAEQIFVNVGGRAVVPPIAGIEAIDFLTNATIMDLDTVPEHLIVLGGSYIGLEFAQIFRRFGSKVTVVEAAPRLVAREDEDVSAAIKDILELEGISIYVDTKCSGLAKHGSGIAATFETASGVVEITGTHLLVAIGRRPNTDDLGLAEAGVRTDKHGFIPTDDSLRTNVPTIWALGDCNGRGAFTHTSYNDFEIVAAQLLDNDPRRASDRIPTYGLFIDPPLGRVGLTAREAIDRGHKVLIGTRPMTRVGRAVEKGETLGFMKIVVDADSRRILGAAILGTGGDEAVHCITATMYADAPYTTLQRSVLIHPTVSELIPTVLGELQAV